LLPILAMSLFDRLRRPAWEHKDADQRRRAVQSDDDPRLQAALPGLAESDPDATVRSAALRRLDDPLLLARRLAAESDPLAVAAARERLRTVLAAPGLAPAQGLEALAMIDDAELIGAVATGAAASELRRAALERVQRPGFVFERCLADPDPALRRWLLERIDSPEALQRLAEAARRRDKTLARAARERCEALQLAAGDPATLARSAGALCDRLQRLAADLPADRDARLAAARAQAEALAPQLSEALRARVQAFVDLADTALRGARGEPVGPAAVPPAADESAADPGPVEAAVTADAPPQDRQPIEASLARLQAMNEALPTPGEHDFAARAGSLEAEAGRLETRLAADPAGHEALHALRQALAARRVQHGALREAERERQEAALEVAIAALEAAIEQGNLGAARAARAPLEGRLPAALRRRLDAADERIAGLERWQRWSGNKVRGRLCEQAEALHGSGLHPDAMVQRVKELQLEWQRLDALEGAAAPAADSGLARRFRALCQRALAPTRGYFEKRRELRGQRAGQLDVLLGEVDAAIDAARGPALLALRRRVVEGLRELDEVSPDKRSALGRALRDRLGRIDAALAAEREAAVGDKRRLIARLRRQLGQASGADAVALAREAQAEWKRLPRGERGQEEPLWQELRALIDPLFERARAGEAQQASARAEADAAANAVLAELEALAADEERLAHADAHLDSLVARWRALGPVADESSAPRERSPRGRDGRDGREGRAPRAPRRAHPLEPRFDAAVNRVQAARERLRQRLQRQEIDRLCEAGALLDRLAAGGEAAEAARRELERLAIPADARSDWAARLGGAGELPDPQAAAEAETVRAELAAGIESPAESVGVRRREQMQRLAARLEGSVAQPPREEIRQALIRLHAVPGLAPDRRAALQARIVAAYEAAAGAR
jgi:DNA repair protein SbcC/Rad50